MARKASPTRKRPPQRKTRKNTKKSQVQNDRNLSAPIPEETLRRLIFRTFGHQRFTQDSPIQPDVWLAFAKASEDVPIDLIITPRAGHAPGSVAISLENRLKHYHLSLSDVKPSWQKSLIAYSRSTVAAKLTFRELMRVVVPMTSWWRALPSSYRSFSAVADRLEDLKQERTEFKKIVNTTDKWDYFRFIVLAGFIKGWRKLPNPEDTAETLQSGNSNFDNIRPIAAYFLELLRNFKPIPGEEEGGEIWSVSLNRRTELALLASRPAIKADAAQNVFEINSRGLTWAIIDCGIDARHPAFLDRNPKLNYAPPAKGQDIPPECSRIAKTFDFTFLRNILAARDGSFEIAGRPKIKFTAQQRKELEDLRRRIGLGREIDWELILPILEVPHTVKAYTKPTHDHGTHVAGIVAGNWPAAENDEGGDLLGICPDLQLYDLRVFDETGGTEEFIIMAALQVVAHLNRFRDRPVINGVNLSLSIRHEVMSYACGRTPICEECTSLVGDGVVVVAAAGNQGFNEALETGGGQFGSFRVASITDPGNAEAVITVGSTHRSEPHAYGVSYFSSRGPTGDGRRKPDLVAPGEKITAPIPNCGSKRMDGTSMAAPHVSGAAALLMARNRELVGRPHMIKQILCESATNLGRESNYQGAGMLDILRALQRV